MLPEQDEDISFFDICSTWSYNAIAINNTLELNGSLNGVLSDNKKYKFISIIKKISCNDSICLVLLSNTDLYKISITNCELIKLNFLEIESPKRRKFTFDSEIADSIEAAEEHIIDIACSHTFSVAITNKNAIYSIPSKIHTFPMHIKFRKLCCGAEHALLLTTNGDVYAFGSSS